MSSFVGGRGTTACDMPSSGQYELEKRKQMTTDQEGLEQQYEVPAVLASYDVEELVAEAVVCLSYGNNGVGGGVGGGRTGNRGRGRGH